MAEEAEKVAVEKAQPTPAATPFSATEKTHSIPIAQPTPATTPSSATENTQPISATPSFEPEKSQTTPTAQPTSATPSSTISEQPSSFSLISTSEADGSASQLPERAETTAEAPKTTTTDDGLFKKVKILDFLETEFEVFGVLIIHTGYNLSNFRVILINKAL